jgi:hypothetical protein
MNQFILNDFWIFLGPAAIYAIFAPRKTEPQWERIGMRVMGVFLLLFTVDYFAMNHLPQSKLHIVLDELQIFLGGMFWGLALFMLCAWGESRKYKRQMALKNELPGSKYKPE